VKEVLKGIGAVFCIVGIPVIVIAAALFAPGVLAGLGALYLVSIGVGLILDRDW
jgi:hypothetical protein